MITTVNRVTSEGAQVQEERWQCSALYHDSAHARQVIDLIASVAGSGSMEIVVLAAPSQEVTRHSVDFSPHDLEEAFRELLITGTTRVQMVRETLPPGFVRAQGPPLELRTIGDRSIPGEILLEGQPLEGLGRPWANLRRAAQPYYYGRQLMSSPQGILLQEYFDQEFQRALIVPPSLFVQALAAQADYYVVSLALEQVTAEAEKIRGLVEFHLKALAVRLVQAKHGNGVSMQVRWEKELQPTVAHMELVPAFRWFRSQGIELGRFAEEQLHILQSQCAQGLIKEEQHRHLQQAFS